MKKIILWILAFIITIASAYYQKITGPSYPYNGSVMFNNREIKYSLDRSHAGEDNCILSIQTGDPSIKGFIFWKRHNTKDAETVNIMRNSGDTLIAELPHQPPAGKLDYGIELVNENNNRVYIPSKGSYITLRFRGDVPFYFLIPHIILIFLAMLFSTRAGIEALTAEKNYKNQVYWTLGLLLIGGILFGMLVQKYAFGTYWSGIPFGIDLTDNKTLIALITWIAALFGMKYSKKPYLWVLGASIIMLIIFLIPHSMMGSELKYE